MSLGDVRKIKPLAAFIALFVLAGIIVRLIALSAALVPGGLTVSSANFRHLANTYQVLYLLNLIPLISGFLGAFVGLAAIRYREKKEVLITSYENIQSRILEFINQIEKGNLNFTYVPVSREKELSGSLEAMRKSIITGSRKEYERNQISKICSEAGLLLQSHKDIDKLTEDTLSFLVKSIDSVVQGAFYIVEEDDKYGNIIRMRSSYAYDRKRFLKEDFKFGQGLVGQAALEKDLIVRTEIPENYATIKSGIIGHARPKSIIISPLMADELVVGLIELASFRNFNSLDCEVIKEVSKIIGRTIQNVQVNIRTIRLLEESKQLSNELIIQKKKLMHNADDLVKAQDELRKSNIKLEEQVKEVHSTNKRSQVLLENANEVIIILSEERRICYVSPSIKSILGYFPEELLGKDETENLHPLDTDKFSRMLDDTRSYPEEKHTIQYRCFTKEGDVIWMEAKSKNLLSDEVIKGYIINSRDISEQRTAAKEQRMRAKMQALSENSSDLIIRIDIFSRCTYINPVIEKYTGLGKDNFIDKPISGTGLNLSVVEVLKDLLKKVSVTNMINSVEMDFPTNESGRIMSVNAIPELNDSGELESVLYACHDITEAKAREEIIRKKQKNISDSINYAFNIQSALMPDEKDLRNILPNSFMFYKPKDVVSGDYPWLLNKRDTVFVGAMDCTGHGVPGALMSVIGLFLQDIITQQVKDINAGELLNKLHVSVVDRLKQAEEGSRINDGMDAALCKINLKDRTLDFAGAHRPLYHVSNGTMTTIKGDRFPVGSTQYRNRKEFINTSIELKQGDSVFFMTDGFPDQFGGPTGKMKFGSSAIVDLIRNNTHLSIFQMGDLFRSTFKEWKGNVKQMDDVLVIGLKL